MQLMTINLNRGIPQGLEYLATLDTVLVKQDLELLEAVLGCETKNKYKLMSNTGELMFKAKEDTSFCNRYCCGPIRSFELDIKDLLGNSIIRLDRPLRCQSVCFPCFLQVSF